MSNKAEGRYYCITPKIWREQWDNDTRLLALYLLTCPHRNMVGYYSLPKQYVMADLEWSEERLAKPFTKLLTEGFIEYDEKARVVLVVNSLKYDRPENPNQVTAALRHIAEVPESPLLARLQEIAEQLCEPLAKRLGQQLGKSVSVTASVTVPATEEETTTPAHAHTREADDLSPEEEPNTSPRWHSWYYHRFCQVCPEKWRHEIDRLLGRGITDELIVTAFERALAANAEHPPSWAAHKLSTWTAYNIRSPADLARWEAEKAREEVAAGAERRRTSKARTGSPVPDERDDLIIR